MTANTIVWYRPFDLRVRDHEPLREAARRGAVLPVFVVEPSYLGRRAAATRPHAVQFEIECLAELSGALQRLGASLVLRRGKTEAVLAALLRETGAEAVLAHRGFLPEERAAEDRLQRRLGGRLELFEGHALTAAGTIRTRAGQPFSVFTAFARAFGAEVSVAKPASAPRHLRPVGALASHPLPTLKALGLAANPALQQGGETEGRARLRRFLRRGAAHYHKRRDRLDLDGTSRLSADLKFGTLSVRSVWSAIGDARVESPGGEAFLNELLWREFYLHTAFDRPEVLSAPLRPEFGSFPWRRESPDWEAWASGRTGYPVVDASARQLQGEGFVHNRARMISASFLTKHLLIHYQAGEAHYLRYLVDGDRAQNNGGWQWSAGCGADAQPYFRVFNPVSQGERFDPQGAYVRRWVPELRNVPARYIHQPWKAPAHVLESVGLRLAVDYPLPIIDHSEGRNRFLALASTRLRRRS